ncbi:MAG: hypothetical protein QXV72_03425 [Sulfolobales archaeon]
MRLTDYYSVLRLFSGKPCVRVEELGSGVAEELIDLELVYRGISGELCVKSMVQLAMVLTKRGCDPTKVSADLNGRDFEAFVAEALLESGYEVFKNFRFGARKWEFDILAVSVPSSLGIAIDCKHWSPRYSSSGKMRDVALAHLEKLKRFLDWCNYEVPDYPSLKKTKKFYGLIVTISESIRGSIQGVVVVPIYYFRDFIKNIGYYVEELKIAALRNPCYIQE